MADITFTSLDGTTKTIPAAHAELTTKLLRAGNWRPPAPDAEVELTEQQQELLREYELVSYEQQETIHLYLTHLYATRRDVEKEQVLGLTDVLSDLHDGEETEEEESSRRWWALMPTIILPLVLLFQQLLANSSN